MKDVLIVRLKQATYYVVRRVRSVAASQIAPAYRVSEVTKDNKKETVIHTSVEPLLYLCVKR